MKVKYFTAAINAAVLILVAATCRNSSAGVFADQVISFSGGTTPTPGYSSAPAALGSPARYFGGPFPSVVSPFSPPYLSSDLVSIGEGGHITLRFAQYVTPSASGPEIGVFAHPGISDVNYPAGKAGPTLSPFDFSTFSIGSAVNVEVSPDNIIWQSLGSQQFTIPTNGFSDVASPYATSPGNVPSDFGIPFTGTLSSFANLTYPQMLTLLNGSGGGTWLDISGTGFSNVGYIRFSLPDDGNSNTELAMEIDAVSIANGGAGSPLPEPSTLLLGALGCIGLLAVRRWKVWR